MPSPDGTLWRCEHCGRTLGQWLDGRMILLHPCYELSDNAAYVQCPTKFCRQVNIWRWGLKDTTDSSPERGPA